MGVGFALPLDALVALAGEVVAGLQLRLLDLRLFLRLCLPRGPGLLFSGPLEKGCVCVCVRFPYAYGKRQSRLGRISPKGT